jgi:DNA-3-methyladenine glycosylase II
VISTLTEIKGIGKWTAEMFLIFSLGRLNVLSLGDSGLKRAFKWLNNNQEENLAQRYDIWKPYNTIASLYLWESVNKGYVDNYIKLEDVRVN